MQNIINIKLKQNRKLMFTTNMKNEMEDLITISLKSINASMV